MTKELRRLGVIVVGMFLALFAASSYIQVVDANALRANDNNRRVQYDQYEVQRGAIVAGRETIATSVPAGDPYSWQREYAESELWSGITGYFNPTTISQGSGGIEQAMNSQLSGSASSAFFARMERVISGSDPQGSNVELTIDPDIQRVIRDAMAGYQGSAVALEPSTGRILGIYSAPGWDANQLAVLDPQAAQRAQDELDGRPGKPMLNSATNDTLPPGSTFKIVVAAAALESGKFTMQSTFKNDTTFRLPGTTTDVFNATRGPCGGGDQVTLHDAIRLSCNVPMADLAVQLGEDAIRQTAEALGFNATFDVPWQTAASAYPVGQSEDKLAQSGFGQSDVRATPFQIAMAAATIAHDGVEMRPHMVAQVVAPDLTVQESTTPGELRRAMSAETAEAVTQAMVASVADGAASRARIDGVDVAGKTGTAEMAADRPYTLWFTGFAPADQPKIAVAVAIEDGGGEGQSGSGDAIAAPIAKSIMEAVLRG